jgi:hypothetical protein
MYVYFKVQTLDDPSLLLSIDLVFWHIFFALDFEILVSVTTLVILVEDCVLLLISVTAQVHTLSFLHEASVNPTTAMLNISFFIVIFI